MQFVTGPTQDNLLLEARRSITFFPQRPLLPTETTAEGDLKLALAFTTCTRGVMVRENRAGA